jgi:hypothetical protein
VQCVEVSGLLLLLITQQGKQELNAERQTERSSYNWQ